MRAIEFLWSFTGVHLCSSKLKKSLFLIKNTCEKNIVHVLEGSNVMTGYSTVVQKKQEGKSWDVRGQGTVAGKRP